MCEELHALGPHRVDRAEDVVGGQRQVLGARAAVELQVLVDLALPLADRRLVQRELHPVVAVGHHLAHQRGVVGGDVVADELGHVGEAHHPVVEVDPLVHLAQLDVADHVVQRLEEPLRRTRPLGVGRRPRHVAGQVRPRRSGTGRPGVCTVSPYAAMPASRTVPCSSVTSCGSITTRAPADAGLADALVDVGHLEADVEHPVAVRAVVVEQRAVRRDAALDHEAAGPAAEDVRLVVPDARSPARRSRPAPCRTRRRRSARSGSRCRPPRRRRPSRSPGTGRRPRRSRPARPAGAAGRRPGRPGTRRG